MATHASTFSKSHFYYQPSLDNYAAHHNREELGFVWLMLLATIAILTLIAYNLPEAVNEDSAREKEIRALEMLTAPRAATPMTVIH